MQRAKTSGSQVADKFSQGARQVEVTEADLPLHCPGRAAPLWSAHPRVYLPIAPGGEALCPYCGTRYLFTGSGAAAGH